MKPVSPAGIESRLADIRQRMASAARRAARQPADVRLVAISKTFGMEQIREAAAAGQVDFGENRVQEALQKIGSSSDLQIRWHLVGHLQSNKARKAAAAFAVIHSVDSVDLLRQLDEAADAAGTAPELLVQVDLAREATKHGAPAGAVRTMLDAAATCRAARVAGLMLLPPLADTPEQARPWFRQLRELRDTLAADGVPDARLRELSMGMSGDFEVAIEEGATMIRVGRAIFGARPRPPAAGHV